MGIIDDARVLVATILAIVGLIGFSIWYASTGGQPTIEQATGKLVEEAIPLPVKIIQYIAEHWGGSIVGALLIIAVVWFFYGNRR